MAAIVAKGISKRYYINDAKTRSFREALAETFRFGANDPTRELWVLRNIDFSVDEGDTLGIIGRNGAGKSTLLKILSRITKPTQGRAEINGRVGSLLEVGTGFHSELSGRENIFLNGAILGMRRTEIQRKFDEIVEFSEIEMFLDTPVKHYSSGMYMRLAFAIAAHLEPEVLIVDEVLAVGDAMFQKKCLAKMRDVGEAGRTVIFVSHDMGAVSRLCKRAIALDHGKLVGDGNATDIVREYIAGSWGMRSDYDFTRDPNPPQDQSVRLLRIRMMDEAGNNKGTFDISKRIGIEMVYEVLRSGEILLPNYQIFNTEGIHVFTIQDVGEWKRRRKEKGIYSTVAWIPGNLLSEGSFIVTAAIVTYVPNMTVHFVARDAVSFDVFDPMDGETARGDYVGNMQGVVRPKVDFETSQLSVK